MGIFGRLRELPFVKKLFARRGEAESRRRWKVSTAIDRNTHCDVCTDLAWHPVGVGQPTRPKHRPQPAIYLEKLFCTHFKYAQIFALGGIESDEKAVKRLNELRKTKDFLAHMIEFYESTRQPPSPTTKSRNDDDAFMDVYFGTLFDFVLESIRWLETEFPAAKAPHGKLREKAVQTEDEAAASENELKTEMGDKRSDEGYDEIVNMASSLRSDRALTRNASVRKSLGRAKKVVIYYD